MTATTLIAILALVGFALYRQTRTSELVRGSRFKLAAIYVVVGVVLGVHVEHNAASVALLLIGLAASLVVGWLRGQRVAIWQSADGRTYSRGTRMTVVLFLGLVAFKFALGTLAYLTHTPYSGSFGEIMLMVGLMVAMQVHIVWQRAERLGFITAGRETEVGPVASTR